MAVLEAVSPNWPSARITMRRRGWASMRPSLPKPARRDDAPGAAPRAWDGASGTAYRIRTGGLRLERAVSWASRRMRREGRKDTTAPGEGHDAVPAPGLEPVMLQEPADR